MKYRLSLALALALSVLIAVNSSAQKYSGREQDRKIIQDACKELKNSDKESQCLEAMNSLIKNPQVSPPSNQKTTLLTRELITLKGVPFDTQGVKDSVRNLCTDSLAKDYAPDLWCKFENDGRISISNFNYGNLGYIAVVKVDKNDALVSFMMEGTKNQMLELATLLTDKYGKQRNYVAAAQVFS